MRTRNLMAATLILIGLMITSAFSAPKVDPELKAKISQVASPKQLGVVLTFNGQRITTNQIAAVKALGITIRVTMRNFSIMGVNATPD